VSYPLPPPDHRHRRPGHDVDPPMLVPTPLVSFAG
jgi:hypothetical protein